MTRFKQLIHEVRIFEASPISLLETLTEILKSRARQTLNSLDLARMISVASQNGFPLDKRARQVLLLFCYSPLVQECGEIVDERPKNLSFGLVVG
jgi:hypothetical protein